jgi:hypothetical protein
MKFYNREKELTLLDTTRISAFEQSKMTFMVGQRRIGKTSLLLKSIENKKSLYLFISKKDEVLLCKDFVVEITEQLGIPIFGEIKTFAVLFDFLMEQSKGNPFTLIIDEFQEFYTLNPTVFGEMQKIWDLKYKTTQLNLILCGSIYSLMNKIFENAKEPLFGRANEKINLKPFTIYTLKEVLMDHFPTYSNTDLLVFFIFTGGVAKYVELFVNKKCFTLDSILDEIFRDNSLLLEEGRNVLIEEFGREYYLYFSILSLIASSKTSRMEIESILQKSTGGYLDKLENDYSIIKSSKPIFAKPGSRTQKYYIEDNFLNFWFRYVYKNRTALEIGNYEYVKNSIKSDFSTFSGLFLERYFKQKMALEGNFSHIGNYWEKGNLNEIDMICVNQKLKEVTFTKIKLQKSTIKLSILREKSQKIIKKEFQGYLIKYQGVSLGDM